MHRFLNGCDWLMLDCWNPGSRARGPQDRPPQRRGTRRRRCGSPRVVELLERVIVVGASAQDEALLVAASIHPSCPRCTQRGSIRSPWAEE
eukprot:1208705-Prymnesium_polylepis.1